MAEILKHKHTNFQRQQVRFSLLAQLDSESDGDLWHFNSLGGNLFVSNLLDADHQLQSGPRCDEGQSGALVGFHPKMAWHALAGIIARNHVSIKHCARKIPKTVLEFNHRSNRILGLGSDFR